MIGEVCYYQEINIGKTQFEHLSPDSYAELLVVSVDGRNVVLSDGTVYQDWNYNRARFAVGDTVSRTRVETRGDGLCYHLVGRGADMWGLLSTDKEKLNCYQITALTQGETGLQILLNDGSSWLVMPPENVAFAHVWHTSNWEIGQNVIISKVVGPNLDKLEGKYAMDYLAPGGGAALVVFQP